MKHDHKHILILLADRARMNFPCSPVALGAEPIWSQRHQTLKQYRGGWPSVVREVLAANPDLRPSSFYERMPMGAMLVELAGDWSEWDSLSVKEPAHEDHERIAAKLLSAYFIAADSEAAALQPKAMKADGWGSRIYGAIAELQSNRSLRTSWGDLAARVAGRPYKDIAAARSGAKVFVPTTHETQLSSDCATLEAHPNLQSSPESALDALLFRQIGDNWPAQHRHAVTLRELDPRARPRFSVDVLLVRAGKAVGAIDIGAGSLACREEYKSGRALKKGWADAFGLPYHECDLMGGEASISKLACCLQWAADLLGVSTQLNREAILEVIRERHASVVHMSIQQLRDFLRARELHTQTAYYVLYEDLKATNDPIWRTLPPRGTIPAMLRREHRTWRDLFGGEPHGPGSRTKRAEAGQTFRDYVDARAAARAGRFDSTHDYHRRHRDVDKRLAYSPETVWPEAFARDGWPGFLGTGPSNIELEGLVAAQVARTCLGLSWARWKRETAGLRPTQTRSAERRAADCYYNPSDLVEFLCMRGALSAETAHEALRCLEAAARTETSVGGAPILAQVPLVEPASSPLATFEELQAEVAGLAVRNTDQYRKARKRQVDAGGTRWPASPAVYCSDFDKRGGWYALFRLPAVDLPDDVMSLTEVAAKCGVSKSAVVRWPLPRIELAYAPRGRGRVFIRRCDLEAFLRRRAERQ